MLFPAFSPSLARLSVGLANVTDDENRGHMAQPPSTQREPPGLHPAQPWVHRHLARSEKGASVHQQQTTWPAASSLSASSLTAEQSLLMTNLLKLLLTKNIHQVYGLMNIPGHKNHLKQLEPH